jgi:hypothetical protein
MKNTISYFFDTDTYTVDRGYTIHVSRAPEFATQAVVEDADGKQTLIDVAEVPYEDFEDFLDAVLEKYEGEQLPSGGDKRRRKECKK